jgi:hypothetical protein
MQWKVLIAHAPGEEQLAEQLAEPLRQAGYEVAHRGTVLVGESIPEETSKILSTGGPVVLCGTVKAMGTKWARRVVNAARQHSGVRVFIVQMEEDADVEAVSFDEAIARYWVDPNKAMQDLIVSLQKYYPLQTDNTAETPLYFDAERRYRELVLESCDIIDLVNLPEHDRHIATRQLELRQLYVALRVRLELLRNMEFGTTESEGIEQRRADLLWSHADYDERIEAVERVPIGKRLAKSDLSPFSPGVVVLGDPGAGKTTLVRWIATAYLLRLKQDPDWKELPDVATLPEKNWLPIIIRCRDLDQNCLNGSLDDILCHTLRKTEMTEAESAAFRSVLQTKLDQGQVLLLVDGLDEITDPVLRARFCQQIEQIHVRYSKTPIIATSRIVGYREMSYRIGRGFEHVTVTEFSREDKDDFARRWCAVTESPEQRKAATAGLIHDIHSADRIERLTGNPMLLTTMALVRRKVGKFPSKRADLYWEAVQVLLNWRSMVDRPLDHHEVIPQLGYIAYAMCDRGVQQLQEDEIISLFEQMRNEYPHIHAVKAHTSQEFLRLLERRTGILVEAGYVRHLGMTVPVFEFRHLIFQEYLAARALIDKCFPGWDRSRSLAEYVAPLAGRTSKVKDKLGREELVVTENWREALRLCAASCSNDDVESVLQAILMPLKDEDAEMTTRPRAVLAALCLADEPNVGEATAQTVLRMFAGQVRENDGDGRIRTSTDAAAMELATSRWSEMLRLSLVEEFRRRDTTIRTPVGGICGMVAAATISQEEETFRKWPEEQVTRITSGEESTAIDAALGIMQLAFEAKALIVPGMTDGLLAMLKGSAPASHAAAWALRWLNDEQMGSRAWRPSPVELESFITIVSDPISDDRLVSGLALILGREHEVRAVESLIDRLQNLDSGARQVVVSALERIVGVREVKPLISRTKAISKIEDVWAITALKSIQSKGIRENVLKGLTWMHINEIDRKLLSKYFNDFLFYIDLPEEIVEERVCQTNERFERPIEEIRLRYEALAEKFF